MESTRFALFARILVEERSRRSLIGLITGGGIATLLAAISENDVALARKKRRKKKGKKRKNRGGVTPPPPPLDDAFGCTVELNSCGQKQLTACPNNNAGACFVTNDEQPFCGNTFVCLECKTDQECAEAIGEEGVRCVRCGDACGIAKTSCLMFAEF